jgi:ubiquitin-protein ligase
MDDGRATIEMRLLSEAGNVQFARHGDALVATETVRIGGVEFTYRIEFPPGYPYDAPRVFLLRPALPTSIEVHRFNNGALCLWGPDEWHPRHSGVWVRGRALAWVYNLILYADAGRWPGIGSR